MEGPVPWVVGRAAEHRDAAHHQARRGTVRSASSATARWPSHRRHGAQVTFSTSSMVVAACGEGLALVSVAVIVHEPTRLSRGEV